MSTNLCLSACNIGGQGGGGGWEAEPGLAWTEL